MRWATSTSRLRRAVAAATLAVQAGLGCGAGPEAPSLVVVTLDTLRRDHVGAYRAGGTAGEPGPGSSAGAAAGARSATPHLDALAARGLVYEAAYTTMPTTGPAHLSLFTGLYPSQHGALRNAVPLPAPLGGRDAALRLRRAGWATAAFVTSRLLARAATGLVGFEIYDAPVGALRPGTDAVEAALAWLDAEPRRPVLLWVHLYDAHAPYGDADEKRRSFPVDAGRYGWIEPAGLSTADRQEMARLYRDGVRAADHALGLLLAGLEPRFERPPLLVVASDHGESLDEHLASRGYGYDHGEFLDPECVEIPLLVVAPGVAPARSAHAVSLRDVYTTLLAAAGLGDPDARAEGREDLRLPGTGPRVVGIERRELGPGARAAARAHRAAAADGRSLVIVGGDGALVAGDDADAPESLAELARALAQIPRAPSGRGRIEPEMREALRSLGYVE